MYKNLLFIISLICINGVFGQIKSKDSILRPKIGLVLSGGGAKGLAHIGVLKVLEKQNIKPDYISGTSMGAIIGSMYAAGYNANQIDSIFHRLNFDSIIYDIKERKYSSFFHKKNGPKYILKLPFSLKKMTIQIPKGLATSQQLYNTLAENLLVANDIEDFNKLNIPFVCISTDIENGKQVLFNKGWLALAVTASALLPTVYKPLEYKNKLLMDGGIVNNYPIKELQDLGAEIIIGSDVQGKILNKEQINSIQNIMDQIISFEVYKEMPLKKFETDIYIHPDINGIGIMDFDKMDELIKRGEKAAEIVLKNKKLWKNKNIKTSTQRKLNFTKPDSISFKKIIINGLKNYKRNYILGKLKIRVGKKVSYEDYIEGINNLIGTENFDQVFYHIQNIDSNPELIINLKEKEEIASFNMGFHYNDVYHINVIGNLQRKHLLVKNDLLSIDLIGGEKTRFNLDYLIDNGFGWNISFHTGFHRFDNQVKSELFFENPTVNQLDLNIEQIQNKIGLEGSLNHSIYFIIGIQHLYKRYYTNVFSGEQNNLPYIFGKNHYVGSFASFNIDNRDDFDFPQKGIYLTLYGSYFPISSNFYRDFDPFSIFTMQMEFTQRMGKKLFFQPSLHLGYIYAKKTSFENDFYLGGNIKYINFDNLDAFPLIEPVSIRATKYFNTALNFKYEIFHNHYIKYGFNYLFYDQSYNFPGDILSSVNGHLFAYEYNSFLGPLRLNYSIIPESKKRLFSISFGYNF